MASFGRRGVSYTPFMAEALGGISEAFQGRREKHLEREENKLVQNAYMGDMQALQELAAVNPERAMEVEDQAAARKEREVSDRKALDAQFEKDVDRAMLQIAKFPDYESAQEFGDRITEQLQAKYPERGLGQPDFSPEVFAQIKTIAGDPVKPQKRQTTVVDGALIDDDTGEVIYRAPKDASMQDRDTMMVDTPEGQILIDKNTGEEISRFSAKPPKEKDPTGEERKAAGFLGRMEAAQVELDNLGDFDPTDAWEAARGQTNLTASAEYQQYRQAAMDWIRAKLRKESGAVIGEEEAAQEYETYFPVFGDSAEVIQQKARSRKQAEEQMRISAGRAAGGGEPPAGEAPPADLSGMSDAELDAAIAAARSGQS